MTRCTIYRSGKRAETYLYVSAERDLTDLPEGLLHSFGDAHFVMELDLSVRSKLARVDVNRVIEMLEESGYFLQLPPEWPVEEEISRGFS